MCLMATGSLRFIFSQKVTQAFTPIRNSKLALSIFLLVEIAVQQKNSITSYALILSQTKSADDSSCATNPLKRLLFPKNLSFLVHLYEIQGLSANFHFFALARCLFRYCLRLQKQKLARNTFESHRQLNPKLEVKIFIKNQI